MAQKGGGGGGGACAWNAPLDPPMKCLSVTVMAVELSNFKLNIWLFATHIVECIKKSGGL